MNEGWTWENVISQANLCHTICILPPHPHQTLLVWLHLPFHAAECTCQKWLISKCQGYLNFFFYHGKCQMCVRVKLGIISQTPVLQHFSPWPVMIHLLISIYLLPLGLFCGKSQTSCHSSVTTSVCMLKGNPFKKHSNSIIKPKKINSFLTSPNTQSVLRFSWLFHESIFSSLFKLHSRCCLMLQLIDVWCSHH